MTSKKQRARELRESGMLYREIGEILGVSTTTADNWATKKPCNQCDCERDSRKGWDKAKCPDCRRASEYGLSCDQFKQLPKSCQICGSEQNLHVDHDHLGGHIRGRLCSNCNTGIGLLRDNPEIMSKAIEYLEAGPFQFSPHEPQ